MHASNWRATIVGFAIVAATVTASRNAHAQAVETFFEKWTFEDGADQNWSIQGGHGDPNEPCNSVNADCLAGEDVHQNLGGADPTLSRLGGS